ncbi:DUF6286 domain-containing protein [Actinophytocola xanthii]|uniref:DUF6286 domain-containing protein n=1 Tax=Actinophytocola xanthii TaxID=1912961 RepID=A0A1Q8BSD6_9PSEU|nr:DUF6286 domain-containing protein [Actinophytocola xanthii]OLF04994.1 hypothetical protein BU204_37475 [Actinophytocola xanthii]
MTRRPRRAVPAVLTALVLLSMSVLTAISAIQLLAGRRPLVSYAAIADWAHATRWDSLVVTAGSAAVLLIGLVLLVAAVLPGRPTVLPLRATDTDATIDAGASRRSLRSTLRAAANAVDGVTATTLTLRGRRVTAVVRTHRTTREGLAEAVRAAVSHRLDQISPATRPAVRVRVVAPRSTP